MFFEAQAVSNMLKPIKLMIYKPLGTQFCGIKMGKRISATCFSEWSSTNKYLNLFVGSVLDLRQEIFRFYNIIKGYNITIDKIPY